MKVDKKVEIDHLSKDDIDNITPLIISLLAELDNTVVDTIQYKQAINQFLEYPHSVILAAKHEGHYIGILTAVESIAIYAGGSYGVIQELYVSPQARSLNIGQQLIQELISYATNKGWTRLEVTTPDPSMWERTVAFYEKQGFKQIGFRLKLPF